MQIPVRVCWFPMHLMSYIMTKLNSCSFNNTSKKGIVLSSFCVSNVSLIEGCKLLICSGNGGEFLDHVPSYLEYYYLSSLRVNLLLVRLTV